MKENKLDDSIKENICRAIKRRSETIEIVLEGQSLSEETLQSINSELAELKKKVDELNNYT